MMTMMSLEALCVVCVACLVHSISAWHTAGTANANNILWQQYVCQGKLDNCAMNCASGYTTDFWGCEICVCNDACEYVTCQEDFICKSNPMQCYWKPCFSFATCEPAPTTMATPGIDKAGLCEDGMPLPDIFCGRGDNRENCPSTHKCMIHPEDGSIAVCCSKITDEFIETYFSQPMCQQPPKTGSCSSQFQHFYFNWDTKSCDQFTYSGCQGNDNNFETLDMCLDSCTNVCSHQPVVGLCKARLERHYYNLTTRRCQSFVFGGCGGNGNNFRSEDQCQEICVLN